MSVLLWLKVQLSMKRGDVLSWQMAPPCPVWGWQRLRVLRVRIIEAVAAEPEV